jgi:hypothetical protein
MPYIVQTASAKMPTSVKAPYRRVAVIQVEPGYTEVSMISPRARGVVRIIDTWERLHAGRNGGTGTAYARALRQARDLAHSLNSIETGLKAKARTA